MNHDLLEILACVRCQAGFALHDITETKGEIESGTLRCETCGATHPIVRFVPRFVSSANYSSSFGFQWNRFRTTQLDSVSGHPISTRRFFQQSNWEPSELAGRWTLDAGCGAGRFAEVALRTGARVVAIDYSRAVDACRENVGGNRRFDAVQADVYRLPLRRASFDFVYCFGVLQHTPDPQASFEALAGQLAAGGRIAVDVYPQSALNALWPKYWLRPVTKRVPPERLLSLVSRMVHLLWPLSLALGRVPGAGRRLRHALPIANYEGLLPLTPAQLKEWAVLDTFDMLSPAHDHPQSAATVKAWFEAQGLADIDVARRGLIVGRGRRAAAEH